MTALEAPDGFAALRARAGSGLSLPAARRDDLPQILALEAAGFAETERWSERSWTGELLGDDRTVLLARAEATLGVIALRTTGELADLHRVVVAPGRRRRGVGWALTLAGLDAVRRRGALAVMLEVDVGNEAAIGLYQRLGFEQLRARTDYYGPGRHALILKLYELDGWPARLLATEAERVAEAAEDAAGRHLVTEWPEATPETSEERSQERSHERPAERAGEEAR